jgi:hypothetical protein
MANGPYKMDIKPMLGKIKELQAFNFENNFNFRLNLNENKGVLKLNYANNDMHRKNFESVNFENLRNLNLEKIENLDVLNSFNYYNDNKSVETINNIQNCMKANTKYESEKINVNDYLLKNKNAPVGAKSEVFENTKISETEFHKNLVCLESLNPHDLLESLSLEEKSIGNSIFTPPKNNIYIDDFNYNDKAIESSLPPKAEFKSVSKSIKAYSGNNDQLNHKNNGGSTACKTLKTKQESTNKNLNSQNKNANLNLKKSTIESKNSDSNISNGLKPINLNMNLEHIACSKESSTENILTDKDIDFNVIKREYKNNVSNGKTTESRNINDHKNNLIDNKNLSSNIENENNSRNNEDNKLIISNVNFDGKDLINSKDGEINFVEKSKCIYKITTNNNIFNNNIINEIPINCNSILANANKNGKEPARAILNKNSHKRISSGLKIISVEKHSNKITITSNDKQNNNLPFKSNANHNQILKAKQIVIKNEEKKDNKETHDLVNGGGISNGNFKVYKTHEQKDLSEAYIYTENKKTAEKNLEEKKKKNISINSALIYDNEIKEAAANNSSSILIQEQLNNVDISKSQAIPITQIKQLSKAFNRQKTYENNSETKILGDDILEDLDEIKDLEVNIKLTKSHKFPRRLLQHQRKKSERKITVSDIDLSSMRESYYNSRILNLNNSSTFNYNLDAIGRKQFFKKFNQNKNSQKNILILDSNLTEEQEQSGNLLSRSISIISKKNISNFERLDKIKFNRRKNSKHLKTSFLSSFQNLNNISSQRVKKAFFNTNLIDNLFFGDNNMNLEMNSFMTLQNKSNYINLNNTNFASSNYYSNNNINNAFHFKYNNNLNQNNDRNFNLYSNLNTNNNKNNNSVFYSNVNKSLSKILLKNNPNSARKNKGIQNINDLVFFLNDNNNNNYSNNPDNNYDDLNCNSKENLDKFEKELSEKNIAENLITDKNFDPLISSERDNVFANGEFIVFNNSDKSNIKFMKKINSNKNILIFDNQENNFSDLKTRNEIYNNNCNNDKNFDFGKFNKKENLNNYSIIDRNDTNINNNKKNICANNEILEISNFLNYNYNLNSKQREKNFENSEMEEHEIKLERHSQGSYNNIPNFKMFNNNNLKNLNSRKNKNKDFERNNSNGIITKYINKSLAKNQKILTEQTNTNKDKGYLYKDTYTNADNYISSEINELSDCSERQKNYADASEKYIDNFDYFNFPTTLNRNITSTNETVDYNFNYINKGVSKKITESNIILDLEYNLYVKTNFDNSHEELERKRKVKNEENLTNCKRARPDCPSPYDSNSNIVISLNNTHNYFEEEKSKSNILDNSAMKKKVKRNYYNQNKNIIKNNKKNINYRDEGSSTNLNENKNNSDDIIDLNSLDSASPQEFDNRKSFKINNNNNNTDNSDNNYKTKPEENDDQVNYSLKKNNYFSGNFKKEKSKFKQEIEIQVEEELGPTEKLQKESINNEPETSKKQIENQNSFVYLTPEKPNNVQEFGNLLKIRNHNKISTNSMLKNSKMALYYCKGKLSSLDKEAFGEQEEQLRIFFEQHQAAMHNIYDLDFINNLLEKENKFKPDENYFVNHSNLTLEHRAILVDWIMEICEDLAFKRDTLHFAVNYLDRFLSKTENIEKNILQLIGVACLSIAGKFEVTLILFIYLLHYIFSKV